VNFAEKKKQQQDVIMSKKFDIILWNSIPLYKRAKNVLGSKREKIETFSFGSASAAKLDVLI